MNEARTYPTAQSDGGAGVDRDTRVNSERGGEREPAVEGGNGANVDPLIIRHLDFLGPQVTKDGWRPENALPEVAFAGRSNVGKSSLLNVLLRRKAIARVSNTPGRTRQINFFSVNKQFVLADLPGYGYAKISKARKAEWKPLIEGYIKNSERLAGVVLLLDARHDASDDDLQMLDFLADVGVPTIVVATKTDKLGAVALTERLSGLADSLGLDEEQLVAFSSRTGEGRTTLAVALNDLLAAPSWRGEDRDGDGFDDESAPTDSAQIDTTQTAGAQTDSAKMHNAQT